MISRRTGDKIAIEGAYQYNAVRYGYAPQKFWHRARYIETCRLLEAARGGRMLDAGCGSGIASRYLHRRLGCEVLGLDANSEAIAFASRRFGSSHVRFQQDLVDDAALESGQFDGIVFLEVIEHLTVKQGESVLRDFYRLLKPGGALVVTTPNRRSPWPFIEWTLDRLRIVPDLGGEQHEHIYSAKELRKMAFAAGFEKAEIRSINFAAPWLAAVNQTLARRLHHLESRSRWIPGAILVARFDKPAQAGATR